MGEGEGGGEREGGVGGALRVIGSLGVVGRTRLVVCWSCTWKGERKGNTHFGGSKGVVVVVHGVGVGIKEGKGCMD